MRRPLVLAAAAVALACAWGLGRRLLRPPVPGPVPEARAQAARVRILRDSFGVPHVYGERDADAAFGLAYAHAEDDFPTIQLVLAAASARLSLLQLSKTALLNDELTQLVGVSEQVDAQLGGLDPHFREVLDGYASGLSYYAALHPGEADGRFLPYTARDVIAGFVHKLPLLLNLPQVLEALRGKRALQAGDLLHEPAPGSGSNAHALRPSRTTSGETFLNINSHQPWEGPVAWYEAQVVSGEGWNMTGGLFPGSPVVLHGHNDHLGWAHTVNSPALIDVYALTARESEYRLDGAWLPFELRHGVIQVDLGLFTLRIPRTYRRTRHGFVFEANGMTYALRQAGVERSARSAEQWFRMDKARSFAEWTAAMRLVAIPMFNVVYADGEGNIEYLYNAALPKGRPGRAWEVRQGDRSDLIWSDYLGLEELPQVINPPAGFVQSCNTTPFSATLGPGNPDPARFEASDGIETGLNNRGLRSLLLFGGDGKLDYQTFKADKFDRRYAPDAPLRDSLKPLFVDYAPRDADEARGLALLRAWDGDTAPENTAAALAILVLRPPHEGQGPREAFRAGVSLLREHFGRIDPPLGEVQRLHRGRVDLPLGGGPDVLNAAYSKLEGGHLVGTQGDSLIVLARFQQGRARSESISQYGASNRPASPHYADQAPLFLRHELKPTLRTEAELRGHLEREYHPGEEAR